MRDSFLNGSGHGADGVRFGGGVVLDLGSLLAIFLDAGFPLGISQALSSVDVVDESGGVESWTFLRRLALVGCSGVMVVDAPSWFRELFSTGGFFRLDAELERIVWGLAPAILVLHCEVFNVPGWRYGDLGRRKHGIHGLEVTRRGVTWR